MATNPTALSHGRVVVYTWRAQRSEGEIEVELHGDVQGRAERCLGLREAFDAGIRCIMCGGFSTAKIKIAWDPRMDGEEAAVDRAVEFFLNSPMV